MQFSSFDDRCLSDKNVLWTAYISSGEHGKKTKIFWEKKYWLTYYQNEPKPCEKHIRLKEKGTFLTSSFASETKQCKIQQINTHSKTICSYSFVIANKTKNPT